MLLENEDGGERVHSSVVAIWQEGIGGWVLPKSGKMRPLSDPEIVRLFGPLDAKSEYNHQCIVTELASGM